MNYIKLLLAAALPIALSALLYSLDTRTKLNTCPRWKKQILFGILFGLVSAAATTLSVNMNGLLFNVRDAGPICAGLIFGGPAGIIAGCMGAAARYLTVFWGVGTYSVLACSLACLFAGVFSALCRSQLFSDRIPRWPSGVIVTLIVEAVHMLLILVTHLDNIQPAFRFVNSCMLPMMAATGLSVALSLAVVVHINRKVVPARPVRSMTASIQSWMAIVAACGFLVTAMVTYSVETIIGYDDIEIILENALDEGKALITMQKSKEIPSDQIVLPSHIQFQGTGALYVLNEQGDLLAAPYPSLPDGFDFQALRQDGIERLVSQSGNGETWFYMYSPFDGYALVAGIPVNSAMALRDASAFILILIEFAIYLAMYVIVYYLTRKIMLQGVQSISSTLARIPGSSSSLHHPQSADSFASLSEDILETADYLKDYVEQSEKRRRNGVWETREAEVLMVPAVFPPFPEEDTFDLYAMLKPGERADGCFYDYFILPGHRLCFLFGQASHTGMSSVLGALFAKTRLHDLIRSGLSLPQSFRDLNATLPGQFKEKMTVTAWAGILNLQNGHLEYVNAGALNPILCLDDKGIRLEDQPSAIIGDTSNAVFTLHHMSLLPGDRICLFSRGILDSVNGQGETFGAKRIQAALHTYKYESSRDAVEHVFETLDTFMAGKKQEQDRAVLEIELLALQQDESLQIRPDKNGMEKLMKFIERRSRRLKLTPLEESRLQMVIDALYGLAKNYSGSSQITVQISRSEQAIEVLYTDDGSYDMAIQKNFYKENETAPNPSFGGMNLYVIRQFAKMEGTDIEGGHQVHVWIDPETMPSGHASASPTNKS